METRGVHERMLPTPFVSSFFGRARSGDLADPDPHRRASAWAHWAVESMTEMVGLSDRSYVALTLPGRFYDPKGTGPTVRPHLEIPARQLPQPDPLFPDRLAQMGNGLLFPWWVVSEVTAVRRALFNTNKGSIEPLLEVLAASRLELVRALQDLATSALPGWSVIEGLLISSPDGLSGDAAGDFSVDEVKGFFPAAAGLRLEVVYDSKLRDKNRQWASRRIGVWQLQGVNPDGSRFSLGALTPRLTANSLFSDRLFLPERESAASLLVRGLLLRRLVERHLDGSSVTVAGPSAPFDKRGGPYLRAVVARVGAKLPEASVPAAVHFLQTYPDAGDAWAALARWAAAPDTVLTVTEEGFRAAHENALRFVRRAEEPEREDINVVLPLAWEKGRVVRVTFSRPTPDESDA